MCLGSVIKRLPTWGKRDLRQVQLRNNISPTRFPLPSQHAVRLFLYSSHLVLFAPQCVEYLARCNQLTRCLYPPAMLTLDYHLPSATPVNSASPPSLYLVTLRLSRWQRSRPHPRHNTQLWSVIPRSRNSSPISYARRSGAQRMFQDARIPTHQTRRCGYRDRLRGKTRQNQKSQKLKRLVRRSRWNGKGKWKRSGHLSRHRRGMV